MCKIIGIILGVLICLIIGITIAFIIIISIEKFKWNSGFCRKCKSPWKLFVHNLCSCECSKRYFLFGSFMRGR